MDWKEKVREGMRLIEEGYKNAPYNGECPYSCPFYDNCTEPMNPLEWTDNDRECE